MSIAISRLGLFLLLAILPLNCRSNQTENFLYAPTSINRFTLTNGMQVCLKQTEYEKGAVVLQLFAMGGYASLNPADRPSGQLAANIAWESGSGVQTADQLSFDLYQESIEIETKIQPFDRQIEAYCPIEGLPSCLKMIRQTFTQPKFDIEALKKVQSDTRISLNTKLHPEPCLCTHDAFLKAHHPDWDAMDPINLTDLDRVNLSKAATFFKQCFGNPSEFILVIVGDMDFKTTRPIIEHYLSSIPVKTIKGPTNPPSPPFPPKITKKEIHTFHRYKEILTRLTLPVPVKTTSSGTDSLDRICHVIKNRLHKQLLQLADPETKLEVSYEFPFFPRLDEAWLTIQFIPHSQQEIDPVVQKIAAVLEELKNQGPTQEEVDSLETCFKDEESDEEENSYLLSLISNYYKANWDVADLFNKKKCVKIEKKMLKNDLEMYLQLDQYSIISLYP